MTLRSPWNKLADKIAKRAYKTDYAVAPVHDVEDDVVGGGGTGVSGEALLTGITAEHPTSEFIYNDDGDLLYSEV